MGLFDRFKKKPEADTPQWPQTPRADTMCLVLMDRVLEDIEPAEAISNFMYDYYCYNAALKVGTQLLSQSLIDYMT